MMSENNFDDVEFDECFDADMMLPDFRLFENYLRLKEDLGNGYVVDYDSAFEDLCAALDSEDYSIVEGIVSLVDYIHRKEE